jgi:hypothetical protein
MNEAQMEEALQHVEGISPCTTPTDEFDSGFDIPEPDLPSYEMNSIEELEVEIAELSLDHLRNTDELGPRVYWLNKKYKAKKRRKGTGVTAFLKRIGWDSKADRNHWNHLVRRYTPEMEKQAKAAEKQAKAAEREMKKRLQSAQATDLDSTPDSLSSFLLIENSINTGFEEVRAFAQQSLSNLGNGEQLALAELILTGLDELEAKIKAWAQPVQGQQVA